MNNIFPMGDKEIKIGMIGFTEGNAHPFSWSAMINGCYDPELMREYCKALYPTIPDYLGKQPKETLGIPGVKVTHICFTGWAGREDAEMCAKINGIPNVCDDPLEMLGQVDAVICATDVGAEHVERCRPFMEAGIPMFIDKPMVTNEEDLRVFLKWREEGKHFMSGSSCRYTKSHEPYHKNHYEFGEIRYVIKSMGKYLETYGIHALEGAYPIIGSGFESVQWLGNGVNSTLYCEHKSGATMIITQSKYLAGGGTIIMGTAGGANPGDGDSYYSFKKQLDMFIQYLRTGVEPFPFAETVELMKLLVGGIQSREQGGRKIMLADIVPEFTQY